MVGCSRIFDFLYFLLIFSLLFCSVICSSDEVRALLEFKKGIKVDPQNKVVSSWNQTAVSTASDLDDCPRSFFGIVCDGSSNAVTAIMLENLGLGGELKFFTLINLKMLQNLSLSGNQFTGRLVPQLGSMSNLQYLDLSNNQFIGRIPDRIHDLWGLQHLNLSLNRFSGGYPVGIRNLQQLRMLDMHSNQLWGDVNNFFLELRNVEYVDLSRNNFTGGLPGHPENITSLYNTLHYLNLSRNLLNGRFFSDKTIMLFKNLEVLDLGNNIVLGELPSSFSSLSNLNVLRVGNNQLYGEIPEDLLTSLIPLKELDLSGNGFTGAIRDINSTSLEVLDLSSNKLTGNFPSFSSQSKLTTLKVSGNFLEGYLPSEWHPLSRLSTVDLSINKFAGPIPPGLFSLNLISLNLSRNHFSGVIPLQSSHISELLVLPSYSPIELLDLSDNSLMGNLPLELVHMGRLRLLYLANNSLSGAIPKDLSKVTELEYLDLSNNHFSGRIPDDLPSNLKALNVSYNNLSGPIPEKLKIFPPSSFCPGNDLLDVSICESSPHGSHRYFPERGRHHSSRASIRVAIIVASVCAAIMIAFVSLAYYRAQIHAFHGRSKFDGDTTGRDVKMGRFIRPSILKLHASSEPSQTSLSFSNDHLLTSTSRSLAGQAEIVTEIVEHVPEGAKSSNLPDKHLVTSERKSSSGSPLSSPRFLGATEQPVTLDVYSPDRFAGELHFLDASLSLSPEDLSRAPAEVLGRSSHGTLYKATLGNGQLLTVKWMRAGLVKHKKEFAKEVKKIGSMRHQNIVPIRGYYWGPKEQERLVLSDYIRGDNLAIHLYESTPRRFPLLLFNQRLHVAIDIARCLLFLHDRGIPHGNLKPTNIILASDNLSTRLTDYGLHRLITPAGIVDQILNLAALGYCAPELTSAAKPIPSLKADVYGFGVILMELLTRRSAGDIISGNSGAVDLTDWVRLCDQEGRRMDCVDREIGEGEEPSRAMEDMLSISLRCIRPVNERPNIREVFEDLQQISG